MSTSWDPALYRGFDDLRSRPFHDLVARVGAASPRRVVDAGCGPGHLTSVLAARWPGAAVEAFDASPDMVLAARDNGIDAVVRDVVDFTPTPDTDVVVANAVLHWEPTHPQLMLRWVEALPPGGWLAVQVPGNFDAPSHALPRELAAEPQWCGRVTLRDADAVRDPAGYADLLSPHAAVDAWETTYLQRLTGDDPVLRWISGTALRPVRDALDDAAYTAFVDELAPRLRAAYPPSPDGSTWFPFRRVFVVAQAG